METHLQQPQTLFTQPVRYEVPNFQRRYVWNQDEQWEPLWDDVTDLAESMLEGNAPDAHFMGAVVLQQVPFPSGTIQRRIIVDGQQRLTTLQLLLDAVQEVLEVRGHEEPSMRLCALVENVSAYREGNDDNAFKVWPTTVDQSAFRHAMSNNLSGAEYTNSRIVQAHDYFKGQVAQWLDKFAGGTSDPARAVLAIEEVLRTRLKLVVIDLGDTDDPHVIFETLNARGTPLLPSDMIKNKILYDAGIDTSDDDSGHSPEEIQLWSFDDDWWAQNVGRGLQRRPRIDVFLNHWLTLRNRSETKPYDEFRIFQQYSQECSQQGKTVVEIAEDIRRIGAVFRDVEELRRKDIVSFLVRRNVMNVGVATPLLLWLLSSEVPSITLRRCLKATESFLVRRVVCGHSARSYGTLFVGLIHELTECPVENADRTIVSYFAGQTAQAGRWPDNQELEERFVTAPLYQWLTRGRLRMVLTGIEEYLRTEMAESQEVPRNLSIEHIMPQAWHRYWPLPDSADEDESVRNRDRAVHTIGNLTLVNGHLNPALSNGAWDRKRNALAEHSVMFLNKALVNDGPETWNEQEIEKRARWLHARAVAVWPHAAGFFAT